MDFQTEPVGLVSVRFYIRAFHLQLHRNHAVVLKMEMQLRRLVLERKMVNDE
jgi:hypothetical protein